jgi:5-hydroxyisourate hydrolase-like protein (transthyretin family)
MVETDKRRKRLQTSRQTAAVLHVSFFFLEHYNRDDSKQMLYEHLHKIPYNVGIQKMDKFFHLLSLIKRAR